MRVNDDKMLSMLGLCRRAGKLFAGYDLCVEKIKQGQAMLALAASDISEKTYKNLCYEADRMQIPARRIRYDKETLGKACGIKAGIVTVTDEGFTKAIVDMADRMDEGGVQYDDKI